MFFRICISLISMDLIHKGWSNCQFISRNRNRSAPLRFRWQGKFGTTISNKIMARNQTFLHFQYRRVFFISCWRCLPQSLLYSNSIRNSGHESAYKNGYCCSDQVLKDFGSLNYDKWVCALMYHLLYCNSFIALEIDGITQHTCPMNIAYVSCWSRRIWKIWG